MLDVPTVSVYVNEDPGRDPDHSAGLQLAAVEARLDYMGSSVLMGRLSSLTVKLGDEWKLDTPGKQMSPDDLHPLATKRYGIVGVFSQM